MYSDYIRNVAIIAHVDHGKTTLVDQLLYQSGMFRTKELDKLAGGEHCKENDITVNVVKGKQLINIRAAGKDDAAKVRTARKMSLELALEYIQEDELVEICPSSIRIRKQLLKEADRRRQAHRT